MAGGIARRFLQAHVEGGTAHVRATAEAVIDELRVACLLTGCRTPGDLRRRPLVVGPELRAWIPTRVPLWERIVGQEEAGWRGSR